MKILAQNIGKFLLLLLVQCNIYKGLAQRSYASNSQLSTGNWFKFSIVQEGIYKLDANYFSANNISTIGINSNSIKIFTSYNGMLNENNSIVPQDDLKEVSIEINDGGDGIFNNNDFILFYATSTTIWQKDSLNKRFIHQKNLYSDTAYYFLTFGSNNGKRIATTTSSTTFNTTVTTYLERHAHELDLVNVLYSGKEWYGEEFSNLRGNNNSRNYSLNWAGLNLTQPITIISNLMARSVGGTSNFSVALNNNIIQNHNFNTTAGGYLDFFGFTSSQTSSSFANQSTLNINFNFNGNANSQGFMNWFEVFATRSLHMQNQNQLLFRDWNSVLPNTTAQFIVQNTTPNTQVWDISNAFEPLRMNVSNSSSQSIFINNASSLKEYIAFNNSGFLIPQNIVRISNQNLHHTQFVDGIIITHPSFITQAQRLANFHFQQYNYKDVVVTTSQIFNEFSGGKNDPTAIRDFVKMYYDKANGDSTKQPKYLVLFGSSSVDYKNRIANNTSFVPGYQSINSLNPLATFTSDDFFGFLNDNDNLNDYTNPPLLDIAIGRIPARNIDEATVFVNKVINYHHPNSFGSWRNEVLFIADDKDNNLHLNDAEVMANATSQTNKFLNLNKIYLDAFALQSTSSGPRYPTVNNSIVAQIFNGSLICNYSGHGSYERLSEEGVFTIEEINKLNNPNKLPLFITATCDFAPYDDPTKNALGSNLLFGNNNTGAIGLLTTTRVVFAFSNKIINENYLKIALQKSQGKYLSLGEGLKRAKNIVYSVFGDIDNNRKFTLLGDPAMQLALPTWQIELQQINNQALTGNDTLKPLTKYSFSGQVQNELGNTLTTFNGPVTITIYDKPQTIFTKGNTPQSPITSFITENNIVFKGKTTATNGYFNLECIIPKDVSSIAGKGKMSLYANNNSNDANGVNNNFYIGGLSNNSLTDNEGPIIKPFLNDENFVNNGLTNENPILIVKFADSSGINASGLGIGHDIVLVIDGKENEAIVLNSYYETLLNSYKQGELRFALPKMSNGQHQLSIKAWDVANNSNIAILDFVVQNSEALTIKNVLNYPNPFANSTNFWFEHNQPNELITVNINIYTITGKLVKQINKQIQTMSTRVNDIFWDGKDEYSEKLAKGVYIYTIIAQSKNGRATTTQKLYLL
jgi:hypothetical protein